MVEANTFRISRMDSPRTRGRGREVGQMRPRSDDDPVEKPDGSEGLRGRVAKAARVAAFRGYKECEKRKQTDSIAGHAGSRLNR